MSLILLNGKPVEELVPPEGVPIHLGIGSLGARFGAQVIDLLVVFVVLLACSLALAFSGALSVSTRIMFLTLLGSLLRTPYFIISELIWNGRTLGKRMTGIRVVNVDGRRLTPHQIAARNLMKELEIFTPLSALFSAALLPHWLTWIAILWSGAVVIVVLSTRRRQRLGDIIAGTLVVETPRSVLLPDLAADTSSIRAAKAQFDFLPAHLEIYGNYELQTLEDLLRNPAKRPSDQDVIKIAQTIIKKIGFSDPVQTGEELAFLNAFYIAQREHLETLRLFGTWREDKFYSRANTMPVKR